MNSKREIWSLRLKTHNVIINYKEVSHQISYKTNSLRDIKKYVFFKNIFILGTCPSIKNRQHNRVKD